jgi:excisionase family DNA binding protein
MTSEEKETVPTSTTQQPELFTASDVARFCQVDLKTIHNWADKGEIRHFRTPGRHLRFRRLDVLDFLRKYGYPIPDVLRMGKPKVAAPWRRSSSWSPSRIRSTPWSRWATSSPTR